MKKKKRQPDVKLITLYALYRAGIETIIGDGRIVKLKTKEKDAMSA